MYSPSLVGSGARGAYWESSRQDSARAPDRTLFMHSELRGAELEASPAANFMGTVVRDTQKHAHRSHCVS